MRLVVLVVCLAITGLAAGCSPQQQTYSCAPGIGPRIGEYYQFAATRDAAGYFHCGTGHA